MFLQLKGNILWWFNRRTLLRRLKKNGIHELYKLRWFLLDVEPKGRLFKEINTLISFMESKKEV
jgi:hypothetical protein